MKRLLLLLILTCAGAAYAQVPGTLSYQGILVDASGNAVTDGSHIVYFEFYDALTGGTLITNRGPFAVSTYKGMFTFIIGNGVGVNNSALPASIADSQTYLQVTADATVLTPRIALTTVPYAFHAVKADAVDASGLTGTVGLANGGTGSTSASGARSNLGLGSLATLNAVGSTEITDGSVSTADIGSGQVTAVKLANSGVTAGTYGTSTTVPQLTIDAHGLVTAGNGLAIPTATGTTTGLLTGADFTTFNAKIGPATAFGGDLSGTHTTATVAKIQGTAVSSSAPTSNQVLQFNSGTGQWTPTSIATGGGTVTSVASGTGLTGGPITASGTLSLANTAVTAGTYGNSTTVPTFTVDAQGRLTAASATSIPTASGTTTGLLTTADWNTFNGKQAAITAGNGLTLSSNNVALGGTLTGATSIGLNSFTLNFGGTGGVGVGAGTPLNKFDVGGAVAVGNGYAGVNTAPTNGLLVQGSVGLGTSTVVNKLDVEGGSAIGATYSGTNAAPTNGLIVEGNMGVGTPSPSSTFAVGANKLNVAGADGDLTFSDANGSITFPAVAAAGSPMIQMFASGSSNADRMVIAHSSAFPTYGLQYQDSNDKFHFLSGGSGVMTIDLGTSNVGISNTSPAYRLDVGGTVRIADGTQGLNKMLVSDATGVASWKNSPINTGFSVYATAATSASAATLVTFGGESYDDGNNFASNLYTVPVAGVYHFDASLRIAGASIDNSYMYFYFGVNGSLTKDVTSVSSTAVWGITGSCDLKLSAGDTVGIYLYGGSNTLTTQTGSVNTWFNGHRVY